MADLRVGWIKERVLVSLNLPEDGLVFDELLRKDGGKAKNQLLSFLEGTGDQGSSVTFYSLVSEVEREVEIEEGASIIINIYLFIYL